MLSARPLADRLELAAPALAAVSVRILGRAPEAVRRKVLRAAFDRARDAFNRGDIEAVTALFADDVVYLPPPPLCGGEIHGRRAVLAYWHVVYRRYRRSTIENLALEEAAPGRIVRRARLRHLGEGADVLEYTILQTTELRAGRVVRQLNELYRSPTEA